MSIKKPIFYSYDLCKKTAVDLLAIIHVDDRNTEVLEVAVTQGGEAVSMTGKTVIARFVSAKDHILFSDNVACSVNEAGNILVPFDNAVIQSRKCDLKIEVKIADGTDVLTLQFPLWVRVNGSILDTAEISPESQGTIPELLRSVLEELERVGEYVDENALFDAIDTAFTGGGTLVPSIAIDNDNQSGDYILYYVDGDFVRHDIFNFSQYFITEPYNLYDPCAAYTVTDASQTGKVGYSVDSGTGSITVTRAQGDGQKYIRYADKTLKAGTYTLSGKVTLHSNAADGNRTMCCNIGYEKTRQQVNLTTERGGSQNIGSSDKEGWFSCTVTLSYDQVFSFEAIPWSTSVCNSNLPAVLSNVQIIEGADIGAYSPAARTSVDIKARTLIGKRGDELASDIAANTTALKNRNGVIYTAATARHSYTVSSGGVINFTVGAKLNTRLYGDNVNSLDWNTVGSEISGSLTVNNETATIRLTDNKALVYNTTNKKLYIRSGTASAAFKNDDILLIYNGYGVPLKGRLYDEYIERRDESASDIVTLNKDALARLDEAKTFVKRRGRTDTYTPPFALLHFSDIHGATTALTRLVELKNHLGSKLSDTICTGDMVNDKYEDTMSFWDGVTGAGSILTCIGNHDVHHQGESSYTADQIGQTDTYTRYFAPYKDGWGVTIGENLTYYYKDYPTNKVRLIALNYLLTGDEATAQNTWLQARLAEAKTNGYTVIIATHCQLQNSNAVDCSFTTFGKTTFGGQLDESYQASVQSFINDGGLFACYISGHTHWDAVAYNSNYPNQLCITVTTASVNMNDNDQPRISGTITQDAANLIVIDVDFKVVKIIRVGANIDTYLRGRNTLTYSYDTHSVLSELPTTQGVLYGNTSN